MNNLKNINLGIANFAMRCVEKAIQDDVDSKKYKTLVKKMPTLIQKNGFIGTLVFNLSKINKEYHKEVLKNIIIWNVENFKINNIHDFNKKKISFNEKNNKDDVEAIKKYIEWVTSLEQGDYRLITKEMMNLFGWIKRFADGMIEGEE